MYNTLTSATCVNPIKWNLLTALVRIETKKKGLNKTRVLISDFPTKMTEKRVKEMFKEINGWASLNVKKRTCFPIRGILARRIASFWKLLTKADQCHFTFLTIAANIASENRHGLACLKDSIWFGTFWKKDTEKKQARNRCLAYCHTYQWFLRNYQLKEKESHS